MPAFLCSYAHGERDGVRPLVEKPRLPNFQFGGIRRSWSATSTERDFVFDEAQFAADKGSLVPVCSMAHNLELRPPYGDPGVPRVIPVGAVLTA